MKTKMSQYLGVNSGWIQVISIPYHLEFTPLFNCCPFNGISNQNGIFLKISSQRKSSQV